MGSKITTITESTIVRIGDKFLRIAIYKAHNGMCFYTGRHLSLDDFHIDHIIPRCKGGKDLVTNYVPTCHQINMRKLGNRHPELEAVTLATNKALFVPMVISIYNDLVWNENTVGGYVDLTAYVNSNRIKDKQRFKMLAKRLFKPSRITKPGQVAHRLYFKKEELESIKQYR